WVETVERVQIVPPREVRVTLRYRMPVLAVAPPEGEGGGKAPPRVVDRGGVLLPLAAADPALPVLYGSVPPPTGRTGQAWGDRGVAAAAAVAHQLAAHQEQLNLKAFEIVDGVLTVSSERTRVVWGKIDETPGDGKLQALLDVRTERGG